MLCRTADRGSGSKTFEQSILDKCIERNDEWAGQVRVHVEGAISDLHAADGRYHVDCMSKFMNTRSAKYAHACSSYTTQDELDNAFCELIAVVSEDLSRIWNSVELLQLYHSKVDQMLTKRQEVDQLVDHVGDNILVLSSPGVSRCCRQMVIRENLEQCINPFAINSETDCQHSQWFSCTCYSKCIQCS